VFKKYKETGSSTKRSLSVHHEDRRGFLPKNVDFDVIYHFEEVTDKDAAIMTAALPPRREFLPDNSAGSRLPGCCS